MNLAIVLHAHLPYVRHPQHEQFLEEHWFFEAMIECYLPLLDMMNRLLQEGVRFRLAIDFSPALLAMMRDPLLISRFRGRMDLLLELCGREITTRNGVEQRLARMYRARWRRLLRLFDQECGRDLVAGFSRLQQEGAIEILACPATHGFLPFLAAAPNAQRAQIAVGVSEYNRHFHRDPKGIWLPECAYAPGLDSILDRHHIRYFLLDTHGFRNGTPPPLHDTMLPARTPAGLAFFGRDEGSAKQVWSSVEGYPGDPWYREFYCDIGHIRPLRSVRRFLPAGIRMDTGLKYWRVTGRPENKAFYHRSRALRRAQVHAEHFVSQRIARLKDGPRGAIAVAPFDAELFGHWWYEGPEWIEGVLRAADGRLLTVTPSEYLDRFPPRRVSAPHFSSWGEHGYGDVWLNPQTDWIYPQLHRMADAMGEMARMESPDASTRRALNQAARELLLAQASDWPFLIRRGGAPHYAESRLREHIGNFQRLERGIHRRRIRRPDLEKMEEQWCLFPDIDYRVFAN